MTTAARTARLAALLADAETARDTAERAEQSVRLLLDRATAKAKKAKEAARDAVRTYRALQKTGAAAGKLRTAAARIERTALQAETAHVARDTARTLLRTATAAYKTAARAYNRAAFRAAVAMGQAVEKLAEHLATVTPAPKADPIITDPMALPSLAEIEAQTEEAATCDAAAKVLAKRASTAKTWLRRLPSGQYGRAVITRTNSGTVIDGEAVAVHYAARGLVVPRKAKALSFRVDSSNLLDDHTTDSLSLAVQAAITDTLAALRMDNVHRLAA